MRILEALSWAEIEAALAFHQSGAGLKTIVKPGR
jgi:hypothetical protein